MITLLLDSEMDFFPFGMIQIPYEPTRSETFEERLVFLMFLVLYKHAGIDLTSKTQNVLIYAM